ncbi:zincin-like metallopeptidase domain-containing protein [Bradyrhizobium sp. WSM4349]|uniref:zincin-like metallopeptidase domain-containing protein n=1 Tax=Bradyrhizobium sp. WSM4349 TaxID=1040988 RepID=UPI003527CE8F
MARSANASAAYAAEELVAEIGAAFLCAELQITQECACRSRSYLAQWLKLMKVGFPRGFRCRRHEENIGACSFTTG